MTNYSNFESSGIVILIITHVHTTSQKSGPKIKRASRGSGLSLTGREREERWFQAEPRWGLEEFLTGRSLKDWGTAKEFEMRQETDRRGLCVWWWGSLLAWRVWNLCKALWGAAMAAFSERLDLSLRSHPLTTGCGAEPVGGSAGGLDQSKASARERERENNHSHKWWCRWRSWWGGN